ncbi:hypothetical protein ABPG72_012799 [Tetrahymena utriculariae]
MLYLRYFNYLKVVTIYKSHFTQTILSCQNFKKKEKKFQKNIPCNFIKSGSQKIKFELLNNKKQNIRSKKYNQENKSKQKIIENIKSKNKQTNQKQLKETNKQE